MPLRQLPHQGGGEIGFLLVGQRRALTFKLKEHKSAKSHQNQSDCKKSVFLNLLLPGGTGSKNGPMPRLHRVTSEISGNKRLIKTQHRERAIKIYKGQIFLNEQFYATNFESQNWSNLYLSNVSSSQIIATLALKESLVMQYICSHAQQLSNGLSPNQLPSPPKKVLQNLIFITFCRITSLLT